MPEKRSPWRLPCARGFANGDQVTVPGVQLTSEQQWPFDLYRHVVAATGTVAVEVTRAGSTVRLEFELR